MTPRQFRPCPSCSAPAPTFGWTLDGPCKCDRRTSPVVHRLRAAARAAAPSYRCGWEKADMTDFHDLNDADRESLYGVPCPSCGRAINPRRPNCHDCDDDPDDTPTARPPIVPSPRSRTRRKPRGT